MQVLHGDTEPKICMIMELCDTDLYDIAWSTGGYDLQQPQNDVLYR